MYVVCMYVYIHTYMYTCNSRTWSALLRILGYFSQGPSFFVREILDSVYPHRRRLQQSRIKYHGLPEPPLVRADPGEQIIKPEFSVMKFLPTSFQKKFQFKKF